MTRKMVTFLAAALCFVVQVSGHGMMLDPPNRSSMWRYGFPVPPNYNDMENFCGGFAVQWEENGGKCGICGDNYATPAPRPNENGGTYGIGVIGKTYSPGSDIPILINLTASHLGHFEFGLCNLDVGPETEDCFQKLHLTDGSDQYPITGGPSALNINLRLPQGLTCKQCSLRWHYRTGNNYGQCDDGSWAEGCGPQETFRNCADVTIE